MAAGAWPQQDAKAELFIDDARRPDHKVSRSDAERLKAIITAAGQLNNPGDPMSIIIGRSGIREEQFRTSNLSLQLALFPDADSMGGCVKPRTPRPEHG